MASRVLVTFDELSLVFWSKTKPFACYANTRQKKQFEKGFFWVQRERKCTKDLHIFFTTKCRLEVHNDIQREIDFDYKKILQILYIEEELGKDKPSIHSSTSHL